MLTKIYTEKLHVNHFWYSYYYIKKNVTINNLELLRHRILGTCYFRIAYFMHTKNVNIKLYSSVY